MSRNIRPMFESRGKSRVARVSVMARPVSPNAVVWYSLGNVTRHHLRISGLLVSALVV